MKIGLIFTFALLFSAFTACLKTPEASTPTATFRHYIEAVNKKDIAAVKEDFSQGSLKLLDETAKLQNISLDETIKIQTNPLGEPLPLPETRNEKIEGENATLEIKNAKTPNWDKVYFTQENGTWKIALDKFRDAKLKEIEAVK